MSPYLAAIYIYPIKSLDKIDVNQAKILESGALEYDREFALFDEQGHFVNGKRNAKVHLLRSAFDADSKTLSLHIQGTDQKAIFHVGDERTLLETWLSDYFGFRVKFVQNTITGFPDDTHAKGPTVISTGTIEEVASWFGDVSVDEMRLRLRANLEIGGVPPFWEDQLFSEADKYVQFKIGEVLFEGVNPCQRCIVPSRDSQTGKVTTHFQKIFVTRRKESLPSWTTPTRFNHFYRLSVNTNIPASEAGKILRQADEVKILGVSESNLRIAD
ncbi:MOSC N-terminal beta barrel domain-containing protein [Brasilonema sp. UFV-L1]|uniref:MOSC domain-containing protein n=1 Tax=Brasilonema sp. UFV-L1 TaxID=2234130 RepID=UPI00145D65FE|nr:MOSC N-terminal beta barrel domain-containing protein [Brasilonema sp. UFV-L1]NMG11543.1 MOSC domain-containing protein [Brasilonema sp. UFV-L1]